MAKHKEQKPEPVDSFSDVVAAFDAAPVALKTWIVSTKGGNVTREVQAETIDDAVRAFNGSQTSFTRKQLDIVEG